MGAGRASAKALEKAARYSIGTTHSLGAYDSCRELSGVWMNVFMHDNNLELQILRVLYRLAFNKLFFVSNYCSSSEFYTRYLISIIIELATEVGGPVCGVFFYILPYSKQFETLYLL